MYLIIFILFKILFQFIHSEFNVGRCTVIILKNDINNKKYNKNIKIEVNYFLFLLGQISKEMAN